MPDPTTVPHVLAFRGAYGRLCSLAAQAIKQGVSREAVRYAMGGEGDYLALAPLREQRGTCNAALVDAVKALKLLGFKESESVEMCISQARVARDAVQSEWGHNLAPGGEDSPWQHLTLPVVRVR